MRKLQPDGRSYQNRLPGTAKGDAPITRALSKLDYNSWRVCGQRGPSHGVRDTGMEKLSIPSEFERI